MARNHPPLWRRGSGADGFEDAAEGTAACEVGGIDDSTDVRITGGRPHRAVAVGYLPLDHGRMQQPL